MRALVIIFSMLLSATAQSQDKAFVCGVNSEAFGFAYPDKRGNSTGMAVDLCNGISAAEGNGQKAIIQHTISKDQIANLQVGNVDVLIRTLEWTMQRDSFLGIRFVVPFFYDVQRMAVRRDLNIRKPEDLQGATVCLTQGNNTEVGISDWFRRNNMQFKSIVFGDPQSTITAFGSNRCDVFTPDMFLLTAELNKLPNRKDFEILPFDVNIRTYGIAVRQGDDVRSLKIRWVMNALIMAEELGITKDNVRILANKSQNPDIQRLLSPQGDHHQRLGLSKDWVINLISTTGNYGEIFNRHFGSDSPITWPDRHLNNLCSAGGRICSIPLQ